MPIDALSVLCAQLTRDLLAIAKFLFATEIDESTLQYGAKTVAEKFHSLSIGNINMLQTGRRQTELRCQWPNVTYIHLY